MNKKEAIDVLITNSLIDDGETREKLAKKLNLKPDNEGKYLDSFIAKIAKEHDITIEEARHTIANTPKLVKLMFVLA